MNLKALLLFVVCAVCLSAGDLIVIVSGVPGAKGEVGCALYRSANGFLMKPASAVASTWVKAAPQVECRFPAVAPGPFAVAVSVDWNGNRKVDKNLLGIPTEPWGVSNNVRPAMRAPRFDEAEVQMPQGDLRIHVKVAK